MADWAALEHELSLWQSAGEVPQFWWRDDDAQTMTPALETLLSIADRHGVPVHLSVIPEGLDPDLPTALNTQPLAYVLQHGLRHKNHEPKGHPASEVGDHRAMEDVTRDLAEGWQTLCQAGFDRLLQVLVPPWNRISDAVRAQLPAMGYAGLSSYPGRGSSDPIERLVQWDGHLDPIRWKKERSFRGEDSMITMTIEALQDRRLGNAHGPIGYLTHHLQTDQAVWDFTQEWLERLTYQGRTKWHAFPVGGRNG